MNKPDSPRTRFSRQKLQEFFGSEIEGLVYRVELIQLVQEPGFERSRRKRSKQRKMKHLAVLSDNVRRHAPAMISLLHVLYLSLNSVLIYHIGIELIALNMTD